MILGASTNTKTSNAQNDFLLQTENRNLNARVTALHDIAQLVVNEPDLMSLAHHLSAKIAEVVEADQVIVGVINLALLEINEVYANKRHHPVEIVIPLQKDRVRYILTRQKLSRRDDLTAEGALPSLLPDQFPCVSALTIPILNHQQHPLGVIECGNVHADGVFADEAEQLLQTIVLQVASGIERAQMFRHLLRWNLSLQSLFAFNAALNEHLDPAILMRRLVEHAAGFFGAEAGLAVLVDRQSEPESELYWYKGGWTDVSIDWRTDQTIPNYVFHHQCPYLTNDYEQDALAMAVFAAEFGVKNAVCVPLLNADETVLGFIEIHNKENGREPFSWSDVSFLESLAYSLAVTLRNTRLMQELDKHRQDLQALSAKHINLLEEERTKISRELHDEAGQALIGIKLNLQLMERQIPAELGELREQARELRQQVNRSTSQLRELARTLRTPALDELGLQAAVQQLVSQFSKQTAMAIHYHTLGLTQRLTRPTETVCYRIIQEALTNVIRHADADQIWITITADDDYIILSVRDDGRGFDTAKLTSGLGLVGIRERVSMLGGDCMIVSQEGSGTQIEIRLSAEQVLEPDAGSHSEGI